MFHTCDSECKDYRETDYPIPGRWQIGEWKFNRCPSTYLTEVVDGWLVTYRMFKNGFLPSNDGWLKQSNKFIQFMNFIDAEVTSHNKEQAEKNGRK